MNKHLSTAAAAAATAEGKKTIKTNNRISKM